MEDEEQEWRNAQPAMPMEGSELGNEHRGKDESMDVDMSEEEGLDDDFIKGCYSLEIGIGSTPLRIWILVLNTYAYTMRSRLITKSLRTPTVGHRPPSLQDNQESASPGTSLSYRSS